MMIKTVGTKKISGPAFAGSLPGGMNWTGVDSYNDAQARIAQAQYGAQGMADQARYGAQGMADQARYGAEGQIGAAKYGAQGMADQARYGAQGQIGAAKYGAQGQIGAANAQAMALTNQAMYDNMSRTRESQDQRATGMAGLYGELGAAGMNAVGQYGSNVAGALANANVAAGNTFGAMANSYYNTMGQMGHIGSALSAAGLAANSNAANARMAGDMGINFGAGFGGGWGGMPGGGFNVSGPDGAVASGSLAGLTMAPGGGFGGGGGGNTGGSWDNTVQRGGSEAERQRMLNQGFGFLDSTMGALNSPNNQAMALAGLADRQFDMNRAALMDPRFLNTMTGMYRDSQAGIDSQSGMYRDRSALGAQRGGQPTYQTSMDPNPFYNYAVAPKTTTPAQNAWQSLKPAGGGGQGFGPPMGTPRPQAQPAWQPPGQPFSGGVRSIDDYKPGSPGFNSPLTPAQKKWGAGKPGAPIYN